MALMTRSAPWPMFTHINWLLKSMKRLPSGVQEEMPLERATGIGSTAAWADHSKSVWWRQSSTISSPVIVSAVVVIGSRCYPDRPRFDNPAFGPRSGFGICLAVRARSQSLKLDELPTSQQRQHYGVNLEISKPSNRLSNPGDDVDQKQN